VASDADLDCEIYEKEFTTLVDGLSTIMKPLMIVFVGAMIGVMVVALYLPIFSAGNAIH
jgi:type IV pilus assembly protein PilC